MVFKNHWYKHEGMLVQAQEHSSTLGRWKRFTVIASLPYGGEQHCSWINVHFITVISQHQSVCRTLCVVVVICVHQSRVVCDIQDCIFKCRLLASGNPLSYMSKIFIYTCRYWWLQNAFVSETVNLKCLKNPLIQIYLKLS